MFRCSASIEDTMRNGKSSGWFSKRSWQSLHDQVLPNALRLFLTCFHAPFSFCHLFWPPLFLPFSQYLFAPSKSAPFCRAKFTAQSLERGRFRMDLSVKFGKEIPSRSLREKVAFVLIIKLSAERRKCSKNKFRTVSNATLARHPLSVRIYCSILSSMGVHLRKENSAFTKAASIPARRQSENAGPRLFGFIFDAGPHLE